MDEGESSSMSEFNLKEHTERAAVVYDYCRPMGALDEQNKDASRLSRLPGAPRDEKRQTLLSWRTGAASYEQWFDSIEPRLFEIEIQWIGLQNSLNFRRC